MSGSVSSLSKSGAMERLREMVNPDIGVNNREINARRVHVAVVSAVPILVSVGEGVSHVERCEPLTGA